MNYSLEEITFDDMRTLIKEARTTNNRYNIEAIRPIIKKWPEGYIVDEEQSVKWNREQVAAHNEEVEKAIKKYHKDLQTGFENFWKDLKQAIQNDYNFTEAQANVILAHIHNDGMSDDLYRAEELCDIVSKVLEVSH